MNKVPRGSVAAVGVLLILSARSVGPTATLVLIVCLGLLGITALLTGRAVRRRSYAAAGMTVVAALLLAGSVLLIAINNESDDWIGL